jgi:hypothetical protein
MMKILTACFIGFATLLGGCAPPNADGTPGAVTTPDIAAIISQVQNYCKIACDFVPTAATIASILSGGNPGVIAASAISQAICTAIAPAPKGAGRKALAPKMVKGWVVTPGAVNGVVIR